jgi:hypothetical protein
MPDDPNKKGQDGKRISQQPHEQSYQRRKGKSKDGATPKGNAISKRSNGKEKSR